MKGLRVIIKMLTLILVSGLLLISCAGPSVVVEPRQPAAVEDRGEFLAGAAETDITPPPGLPVFGFSIMGEGKTKGYWTRLKSRVIVFQYKNKNSAPSKRFALVQLDWGAVSGLVYWKVAEKIAKFGFKPGDFLISASHTHAAPGGFFGVMFYNSFAGGEICINCYLEPLVEWKTTQIAKSIEKAIADLKPAVVGAGEVMIEDISRNRSIEAWMLNWKEKPLEVPYHKVIPRFHVLRMDHVAGDGTTVPRAAFIVAPLHSTSVGQQNKYYHGDLFGIASRYMASAVKKEFKLERSFIAAVVPGPQGDVSPNWSEQGRKEAKRLGQKIAKNVFPVFNGLTGTLKAVEIDSAYVERELNKAFVGKDEEGNDILLPKNPVVGAPIMGGTEDGRWDKYGSLGVFEGHTQFPNPGDEHGVKIPLGEDERFQEIFITEGLPDIAALQVVRLKDVITFATIPGEPTTETGRLIDKELEKIRSHENTAVIAVANEYLSYIATCPEYQAQHFEGAFTLFGENQARYFRQQLVDMAKKMSTGDKPEPLKTNKREFEPGSARKIFNMARPVRPGKWEPVKVAGSKNIVTLTDKTQIDDEDLQALDSEYWPVSFSWKGLKTGRMGDRLPSVWVEKDGEVLVNTEGVFETDEWLHFIIKRKGRSRRWSATWTPPTGLDAGAEYRIKVGRPGMEPLVSDVFKLTKK